MRSFRNREIIANFITVNETTVSNTDLKFNLQLI